MIELLKKIIKFTFVTAIVAVAGYNVYESQSVMNGMSEFALANVEALAGGEDNWGCPNCGTCTGTFYVCESDYDSWWNDAQRNCSSLDLILIPIPGC